MKRSRSRHPLPTIFCVLLLLCAGCGRRPKINIPSAPAGGGEEVGVASWYGHPYHGRRTANGEVYDMNRLTAAHRTLPFDTWVKVVNLENGRSSTVRINDRGPFVEGRIIDLSRKSAEELDMIGPGTARVRISIVDPGHSPALELFTVQVGAFRERDNARALQERLSGKFQNVFIQRAGDYHRVRVGKLPTMAQASGLADRLRREPGVDGAVVVRLD